MNLQVQENPERDVNELIRRAKAGDKEAFVMLVQAYDPLIRAIARTFSRNHRLEANDLVSEVILRAYIILPQFKGQELEFKSWLRKTSWGICNNFLVKQKKTYEKEEELKFFSQTNIPQPDEKHEQKDRQECVRKAVARLPEKFRKPVHLKYFKELRYEDIAAILKIPVGTVKSRLTRGCKKLEHFLKELHCDDMLD